MTPTFRTEPPDIDHVLCRELSATADLGTLLTQPVQQGADRNSVPPRQRHRPHARCVVRQNRRLLTRQSLPRPTPSAQPRHLPRLRSRLQSRSLLRRARRRTGVAKVGIPSQRLRRRARSRTRVRLLAVALVKRRPSRRRLAFRTGIPRDSPRGPRGCREARVAVRREPAGPVVQNGPSVSRFWSMAHGSHWEMPRAARTGACLPDGLDERVARGWPASA